jgi:hypothetical protein
MHSPRASRLSESGSARRHWSARLSMMWSTNSCGNRGGESEGVGISVIVWVRLDGVRHPGNQELVINT